MEGKQNLTLTLAMRVEYNSNPVCQINCFANYKTSWHNLPSVQAGDNAGNIPYTSDIAYNLHQAYPGVDAWTGRRASASAGRLTATARP